MNQQEIIEAKQALELSLRNIQAIKKPLNDAKAWSWFDIMGNGIIGSYFKRQKIKEINDYVIDLQHNLNVAVKELRDINLDVDLRISDNQNDELLDVWFDNIFTDARVHGEINTLRDNLNQLEEQINRILQVVDKEII